MMASSLVEPEPDFQNLSDFVGYHKDYDDEDSLIISTLASVAAKASLAVCWVVWRHIWRLTPLNMS